MGGWRGRLGRWMVTITATGVSGYVLDLIATAAGIALVASGLLAGWSIAALLPIVVASYASWGVGMAAGIRANHALLATTGTSTNVVAKAAHDLAVRLGASARTVALATGAGYVATSVVKEIPYYVGAFGVVAMSDAVGPAEGLVFIAGANLGAAGYELVVARLVRSVVGAARPAGIAAPDAPG